MIPCLEPVLMMTEGASWRALLELWLNYMFIAIQNQTTTHMTGAKT